MIKELRQELYTESYEKINWSKARNECAGADLYYPQSGLLKVLNGLLNIYEKVAIKSWRKKFTEGELTTLRTRVEEISHTFYSDTDW